MLFHMTDIYLLNLLALFMPNVKTVTLMLDFLVFETAKLL